MDLKFSYRAVCYCRAMSASIISLGLLCLAGPHCASWVLQPGGTYKLLPSLGIALPPSYPFPISYILLFCSCVSLPHGPPFTFPFLWLLSIPAFSMCAVDPNPGPHACTIDTLLTEPSPQFRMLQSLKMHCVQPRC